MPIYEYKCTACNYAGDFLQKVNDAPKTTCPKCAKEALVRLVSATSFQLKGTGWYATDFKNPSAPPGAASTGAKTNTEDK